MFDYNAYFEKENSERRENFSNRFLPMCKNISEREIVFEGKKYLNFSSNSYLSLSKNKNILEAAKAALYEYGSGALASRYVSGNNDLYESLEIEIASFKGFESALIFSSGYTANVALITALVGKKDIVFLDKLSHASIIDGVKMANAPFKTFAHRDYGKLIKLLEERRDDYEKAFIITESVFSMDGDIADLNILSEIKEKYNCLLLVDEAHGTGFFGNEGSGLISHTGAKVDIEIGTLSKALASVGGYVAANSVIIEYIKNNARPLMYTTGLPPSSLGASIQAIKETRKLDEIEQYRKRCFDFRKKLINEGYNTYNSESQIVPIKTGSNKDTLLASEKLREKGIFAVGIRPPTVPIGEGRIRLSVCRAHTEEDLEKAFKAIVECVKPI